MAQVIGLYDAIINGDANRARSATEAAIAAGTAPMDLVSESMVPAMDEARRLFETKEYFVPELVLLSRAMKSAMKILRPLLAAAGQKMSNRVVIGSVMGDWDDIGKNVVASMLECGGFEVIDLGTNVSPQAFVAAVKEQDTQLVCMSAMLTVTNRFSTDTDAEVSLLRKIAIAAGAEDAVVSEHLSEGGAGAVALGETVVAACQQPNDFHFLYPADASIKEKIECIAREVYGAAGVEYSPEAEKKIDLYTRQGFDKLPACMAKTQYSLSHDPELKGAPTGFIVPIRDIRASAGAGFVYPLLGKMSTMPGLSPRPGYYEIDIDTQTGRVIGLS